MVRFLLTLFEQFLSYQLFYSELCKNYIRLEDINCTNEECYCLQYMNPNAPSLIKIFFNITMEFSDHTGTLGNCKLYNRFAENLFGMNVEQFLDLDDTQKGILKWKIQLERCAVKLVIKKRSIIRARPVISVVECTAVSLEEVAKNLKTY